jgi:hypothetical protein
MCIDTISLTRAAKVPTAIYTSSAEPVCIVDTMGERKDDAEVARRLVACWNACRGFTTEEMEAWSFQMDEARKRNPATQEPRHD